MIVQYPLTECEHEYPDDWELGGPNGGDVRVDPRWRPTTYEYFDRKFKKLTVTQVPICDHAALGYHRQAIESRCHKTASYIMATRPDGKPEMILNSLPGPVDEEE